MQCIDAPSGAVHVVLSPIWHIVVAGKQRSRSCSAARNSGVLHEVAKPDLCTAWPSASPGAALASKSHSIGASSQCSCRMRLVSSHHCVRSVWVLPLCGACAMKNQQSNKGWSQRSSMRLGSPCTTQKVLRVSLCSMYLCFLLCHPMGWSRSNQISTPRCPLQWPEAKHRKLLATRTPASDLAS